MLNFSEFKTIFDLVKRFPDELSCHQYLVSRRWNGYMTCPHKGCEGDKAYVFKDGMRYKCACCRKIYTVRTGSILECSNLPLVKWFTAFYLIMHKKGISSVQLSKDLGVTQRTAWFLLHRIRFTLGNEKQVKLSGEIQIDETFVGGKNKNRHFDKKVKNSQGRVFIDKTPVMGMLQKEEYELVERPHKIIPFRTVKEKVIKHAGVMKCHVTLNTTAQQLRPLIHQHIEKGSIIVSDEWKAYHGLNRYYNHQVVDHSRNNYKNELGYSSNGIESHWSQFKRGIIGIYHCVSRKHMNNYVQEFVFKYNYRNLAVSHQMDFFIQRMECRLTYKQLIA